MTWRGARGKTKEVVWRIRQGHLPMHKTARVLYKNYFQEHAESSKLLIFKKFSYSKRDAQSWDSAHSVNKPTSLPKNAIFLLENSLTRRENFLSFFTGTEWVVIYFACTKTCAKHLRQTTSYIQSEMKDGMAGRSNFKKWFNGSRNLKFTSENVCSLPVTEIYIYTYIS